jgi:uncharacterized tellurite resistance protein B-like protein
MTRMAQARLQLIDIRCVKQQEIGDDEPYLMIRKNKVWSHNSMKTGMTVSLRSIAPMAFADTIELTLMEKERFGRDDVLGTHTATADQVGKGELQFDFREKGCHYQVVYQVLPAAGVSPQPGAPQQQSPQQGGFGGGMPQQPQQGGFGGGMPPQQGGFGGMPQQPQQGGFGGGMPQQGYGQPQPVFGGPPQPVFGGQPQPMFGGQPQGGFGGGMPQQGGFGGMPQQQGGFGGGFGGGMPQQQGGFGGGFGNVPLFGGMLDPMSATSLWLALAFLALATADGEVSANELVAYQRAIANNGLPDPSQRFTWAQMIAMLRDGTLQNLSGYIVAVHPPDRRNALIPIMLQIVVADGKAGPAELAKMQQVASWIGAQVTFTYG